MLVATRSSPLPLYDAPYRGYGYYPYRDDGYYYGPTLPEAYPVGSSRLVAGNGPRGSRRSR